MLPTKNAIPLLKSQHQTPSSTRAISYQLLLLTTFLSCITFLCIVSKPFSIFTCIISKFGYKFNTITSKHATSISYRSNPCIPGVYNTPSQLPWSVWQVDEYLKIPIYATRDLDSRNQAEIQNVVIIQHGNLRNANNYFCAAMDSLSESPEFDSYLVIGTQFLNIGDNCWEYGLLKTVTDTFSCGLPGRVQYTILSLLYYRLLYYLYTH
jgi:hypothetical protein